MDQEANSNLYLIGFSTTGKSTVGRLVAAAIGWRFVDTDEEIERRAGKPIPQIFAEDGEDAFREWEASVLRSLAEEEKVVVSTGGGIILRQVNRDVMAKGIVVCLEARPSTIHQRLLTDSQNEENPVVRPLLAGENPLQRIESLKEYRQPLYATGDWTVHTDLLGIEEVTEEVLRGWHTILAARKKKGQTGERSAYSLPDRKEEDAPYCEASGAKAVVRTETTTYPVFVEWNALESLGRRMRNAGLKGTANVMSDSVIFPLYGERVVSILEEAGFVARSFVVRSGEQSKALAVATTVYDWLISEHAERGHPIVALGGGVVGDLAGYVAATYLRGVPFVQVPTTLLAMVDASIGGKVAVNHPLGKNLIGAFYQPRLVLADIATLQTLPRRELVSGWAEFVKHGLILDASLFELIEANSASILALDPSVTTDLVARSADIKARVVTEDEKEQGLRAVLNYGHTVAHGLEASTSYGQLLHGEAVSIGMVAAARISARMGLVPVATVQRQNSVLSALGLPMCFPEINVDSVLRAMSLDKKVSGKAIRWILLEDIGKVTIRNDVPLELVTEVLEGLNR